MRIILAAGLAVAAASMVGGCAMGPVSARQRAETADFPQDHPHPPPRLAGAPLDGSTDKLYCTNDGPNTICNRQSTP